ncbi:MAG: heavy metal translocating P-type ATPase [Oscillospiraceae bacterium]|jgi:heavy metal translocating P-type ATPase|nr:heavy metal translocating P-type ATPase [Oscillospiraceae bacterium]
MNYIIASDLPATSSLPGRLRLRLERGSAVYAASALNESPCIIGAKASAVTGSVVLHYRPDCRGAALTAVSALDENVLPAEAEADIGLEFRKRLYQKLGVHFAKKLLLPVWIRIPLDILHAFRFIRRAAASLRERKLGVAVLDGAAISAAMLQGDFNAASSIMLLLGVSELLEDYARRRARGALSRSLVLNADIVWIMENGAERQIPLAQLHVGAHAIVRCGSVIPADGIALEGEAAVNQSSLTGESTPVFKRPGDTVFAGTALEEGSLVIEVRSVAAESRIARIVDLIDRSESLKAGVQSRAERMADKVVPFSFALAAAAFALGGAQKALSALLVDYSCAVKLSTPISVISAMREAASRKLVIKGGKFLEAAAEADTVVFDKTGTLTTACPQVFHVGAFGGFTRDEVLRTAACIEEHFPHSLARAVISKAKEEGLSHEEEHADVTYIAAHGIATFYGGRRVVIGSRHFVEEDEHIPILPEQSAQIEAEAQGASVLYLGADGRLAGFLCIADPPRPEAIEVVAGLRALGVRHIVLLTGDGDQAARAMSRRLGIDECRAQVLPEDKQAFVENLRSSGHKVLMVGDGINDSPALAAADVSVAMRDASALARETADVTLLSDDLRGILTLRLLGLRLLRRIRGNFGFIAGFNSALISLGLSGAISASTLALLHNASTTAVSAASTKPLLGAAQYENIQAKK